MGGRSSSTSPAIRSGSRLVAMIRREGAAASSSAIARAASGSSCSRLSSTTCACLSPRRVATASAVSPEAPSWSGDEGNDERRIPHGSERHEDRASIGLVGQESRQLDRESCLARASRTDDREQPWIAVEPECGGVEELTLAAEEPGRRSGEVDGTWCPKWREVARPELEQLGRRIEVLQAMATEVTQRLILDERCRRGREDHLAAVGEGGHASAAMHVDSDVALGRNARCARVKTHSHRDRPDRERLLGRVGCRNGSGCRGERDEEGVTLGIDLDTTLGAECIAQHTAMLGKRIRVATGAELPEQPGRALDVREQQRDRSGREALSTCAEYRSGGRP